MDSLDRAMVPLVAPTSRLVPKRGRRSVRLMPPLPIPSFSDGERLLNRVFLITVEGRSWSLPAGIVLVSAQNLAGSSQTRDQLS
jgi:hypothetical protein